MEENLVVFFVSGHGFGHASRDVEVVNQLPASVGVLIRSAVDPQLLTRTVKRPYELLSGPCDTGVVQTTSVNHDDRATVDAAVEFYGEFKARVDAEVALLAPRHVALVVGDIAPLAFEVASRLGVPSVALANFTWDWIYETHPGFVPEHSWVIERIRAAYRKATVALQLPFSDGFSVFPRVRRIPLVARRPTKSRAETRAHLGLDPDRHVVLLSFGGYGMPELDLDAVDCRDDWTIVTTDRTSPGQRAGAPHVRLFQNAAFASGEIRYEDLVAAVDVVMTKPGYGIIAECIAANTAICYTSRGAFREYDLLVRELPRYLRSRFISHADLFAGRWQAALEGLLSDPEPRETLPLNGAEVAANIMRELIE